MKMKLHVVIILSWVCLLLSACIALAQFDETGDAGADALRGGLMEVGGTETDLVFYERVSNFGNCDWLPPGSICLKFSDKYKWIVHDYWINSSPIPVGTSNCLPVELIRCYYADYYHVLGTSLVALDERDLQVDIETPPEICPQMPFPPR